MTFNLNADEVFAIAEQIEINGGKFYGQAADAVDYASTKKTLLDLAAMEDDHERFFAGLRSTLQSQSGGPWTIDPNDEAANYLKAFADGHVFETDKDASWKFTGQELPEDILRTAIRFEKDAIVFFLGLKDAVPERLGKDKIDALIKEEQRHIVILTRALTDLKKEHSS
ncbi:MAG: ferritin family protein [Deltaproteobacteria bacterium]|nr:ferritin family protein [Deltaproteobacteria bacterium]